MALGRGFVDALALRRSSPLPGHLRGDSAFVEENQLLRRDGLDGPEVLFSPFTVGLGVALGCVKGFFFTPLAHLPQYLPHPALGDPNTRPGQPLAQLRFGQIRLLAQPAAQARSHLGIHSTDGTATLLHAPLLLPGT